MKRVIAYAAALVITAIAGSAFAGIIGTKDLGDNANMNYVVLKCPQGSWPVGLGYVDFKRGDAIDAFTVMCRDKQGAEFPVHHRDFDNTNVEMLKLTCEPGWNFVGVYYEDEKGKDWADAATIICRRGKGRNAREKQVYNPDLEHKTPGKEVKITRTKTRVKGIAYKDLKNSDKADGVTIYE